MDNCYTIKLPDNLSMDSVDELYRVAIMSKVVYGVIFDFTNVTFVTPHNLILIVTASRYLSDRYNRAVAWRQIRPQILGYMDRMNINEFDFISIERPSVFKRHGYKKSDALVELSVIKNTQQIGRAIRQTKDILNRWFPDNRNNCKLHLSTLIKETVENSIEHSGDEPSNGFCYYVLQKYGYADGTTEVQIAVGDTGVGMLASQRRVHPSTKNDAEALLEAVWNGRSGRESGGGMGYINIKESLAPLHGKVYIRSGRAHLEHIAGESYARIFRHSYSCPGTQIVFQCRA